jgi:hypothetical protein
MLNATTDFQAALSAEPTVTTKAEGGIYSGRPVTQPDGAYITVHSPVFTPTDTAKKYSMLIVCYCESQSELAVLVDSVVAFLASTKVINGRFYYKIYLSRTVNEEIKLDNGFFFCTLNYEVATSDWD